MADRLRFPSGLFQSAPTADAAGERSDVYKRINPVVSIRADRRCGRRGACLGHDARPRVVSIRADRRCGRRAGTAAAEAVGAVAFQSAPTADAAGELTASRVLILDGSKF